MNIFAQKRNQEESKRGSVKDNIAFFESMSKPKAADSSKDSSKRAEKDSEVGDSERKSVKELAMLFGGTVQKNKSDPPPKAAVQKKSLGQAFLESVSKEASPRGDTEAKPEPSKVRGKSLGDAFLEKVNQQTEVQVKPAKKVEIER